MRLLHVSGLHAFLGLSDDTLVQATSLQIDLPDSTLVPNQFFLLSAARIIFPSWKSYQVLPLFQAHSWLPRTPRESPQSLTWPTVLLIRGSIYLCSLIFLCALNLCLSPQCSSLSQIESLSVSQTHQPALYLWAFGWALSST